MTASASGAPAPFLPGEVLVRTYRIERVLGSGGMGIVLAARNIELGEPVAIKLLTGEHTPEAKSRFLGEARAAARIRSDHVVRIFEFGRAEDGCPYIVMEYLEGQDIERVMAGGRAPVADAVRWILEACEALAHAHRQGIIDRDLKPANLFLEQRADGSTRIKLLDFGIAKFPQAFGLTGTSQLLGSPAFMAPEQLEDARDVDVRTDVWGLGGILYEALTGRRPFEGQTVFELIHKIRQTSHTSARALRSELPWELSEIIDRCLAKTREGRWPNIAALARALAPFAPESSQHLVRSIEAVSGVATEGAPPEPFDATRERFLRQLHEVAIQLRDGHFYGGMEHGFPGSMGEIAKLLNEHFELLKAYRAEHLRLMEQIGTLGSLGRQMEPPQGTDGWHGGWKEMADATNLLAMNLTVQVREFARIASDLLHGKHDARLTSGFIGGEVRVLRELFNTLAERLRGR